MFHTYVQCKPGKRVTKKSFQLTAVLLLCVVCVGCVVIKMRKIINLIRRSGLVEINSDEVCCFVDLNAQKNHVS